MPDVEAAKGQRPAAQLGHLDANSDVSGRLKFSIADYRVKIRHTYMRGSVDHEQRDVARQAAPASAGD